MRLTESGLTLARSTGDAPMCILVPITLSSADEEQLLSVAEAHARAFGAELILLHVLPKGAAAPDGSVSPAEAQARACLDILAARLRGAELRAAAVVRTGPVAATVAETAHEHGAALVILCSGSSAQTRLVRLLPWPRGPAEGIARHVLCPVLLVRPSHRDAAGYAAPAVPAVRSFADDVTCVGPATSHARGTRTVDVARIVGSVGRAAYLGGDFRTLGTPSEGADRYTRVLALVERGEMLPPVELYRLGYGYYVLDGHQRVAAARALGQLWLDAVVTEFVPLADADAQRTLAERVAFEQATGLTRIGTARPGNYARLEALIRDHAARHACTDLREAAARWYARVFRPVQRRLRALRLHEHFPGERSADVFVRVAGHRRTESERNSQLPSWEEALQTFRAAPRAAGTTRRAA